MPQASVEHAASRPRSNAHTVLQGGRFHRVRVSPTMEPHLHVRGVFSVDARLNANRDKKPTFELRDQTINSKNKGKAKKTKKNKQSFQYFDCNYLSGD